MPLKKASSAKQRARANPSMKNLFSQRPSVLGVCVALMSVSMFGGQSTNKAVVPSSGKLKLQIERTANSDELRLMLSGSEPKKYYILSAPGVSNVTWSVETVVDGAISSAVTLHIGNKPQAFFKVIPEDDFPPGNISNFVAAAAAAVARNAVSREGVKEWFVDRKSGHDSFDGRTKSRSGGNGPFASVRKAMPQRSE